MEQNVRFVSFDTETTGLGPDLHRLTEIAAVEFDPLTGIPTGNNFYTLLNPEQELDPEASKITGKTWDMLKGEPLFKDIVESLLEFLGDAHVVIHNAPFDVGFLDAELKRAKVKGKFATKVRTVTDTLALSRRYVPAKVHTLDALCDRYGVDRTSRVLHGALVDCEMLSRVYPPLLADVAESRRRISNILPFELDAEMPEKLDDMADRFLQITELYNLLDKERSRYSDAIKKVVMGANHKGPFYSIDFTNTTKTDWEKVTKEHLVGVDLAPYRSGSSSMKIRYL